MVKALPGQAWSRLCEGDPWAARCMEQPYVLHHTGPEEVREEAGCGGGGNGHMSPHCNVFAYGMVYLWWCGGVSCVPTAVCMQMHMPWGW